MEETTSSRPRHPRPRIIPVMDIRGGVVVRAIAGRREEYKPLVSRLTDSTDPVIVAHALREVAKTDELYVADLDGIASSRASYDLIEAISGLGLRLWVDGGVRHDAVDELLLLGAGAYRV